MESKAAAASSISSQIQATVIAKFKELKEVYESYNQIQEKRDEEFEAVKVELELKNEQLALKDKQLKSLTAKLDQKTREMIVIDEDLSIKTMKLEEKEENCFELTQHIDKLFAEFQWLQQKNRLEALQRTKAEEKLNYAMQIIQEKCAEISELESLLLAGEANRSADDDYVGEEQENLSPAPVRRARSFSAGMNSLSPIPEEDSQDEFDDRWVCSIIFLTTQSSLWLIISNVSMLQSSQSAPELDTSPGHRRTQLTPVRPVVRSSRRKKRFSLLYKIAVY